MLKDYHYGLISDIFHIVNSTASLGSFFVANFSERKLELKKAIIMNAITLTGLLITSPAFAAGFADVAKIQTFIPNLIQVLSTLAGLVVVTHYKY